MKGIGSFKAGIGGMPTMSKPAAKVKDPLAGLKDLGTEEANCKQELDAIQQSFKDRAQAEKKRFERATDSEFWTCLCFETREQKEKFLAAVGALSSGDKYIDGRLIAKKLGIDL